MLKKINLFIIAFIISSSFIINVNAFFYGSIFSLESLNIAKANDIEISPAYNSRTICLARKKEYNKKFKKYIRSTCFQKEGNLDKYFYLICDSKKFETCDVDLYLGEPINIKGLKPVIISEEKIREKIRKEMKKEYIINDIYNNLGKLLSDNSNDQDTTYLYDFIDNYILNKGNNINNLEKLNYFISKVWENKQKRAYINIYNKYKLKEIRFINISNNTYFSIDDFFAKRVPTENLDKIKKVKVIFENEDTNKIYTLKLSFRENESLADYNINDIITGIFTDTQTGEDYDINDVITKIFTEDDNSMDIIIEHNENSNSNGNTSLEDTLNMIFGTTTTTTTNNNNNNNNSDDSDSDMSLQEVLNKIFN